MVVPSQEASPEKGVGKIRWESFALSTHVPHFTREIERILRENEIVIFEWSPVHLKTILRTWFWKQDSPDVLAFDIWQKMSCYLYFPRLLNEEVFRGAIEKGAASQDFFGLAYGKETDQYVGFSFNKTFSAALDHSLLLIDPDVARKIEEKRKSQGSSPPGGSTNGTIIEKTPGSEGSIPPPTDSHTGSTKKRFYASMELDPQGPKAIFTQIVDEILSHFNRRPDVTVTISLEIHAETSKQFDEGFQRTIKENCNVLKFKSAEFED